jgi:hypothetical protein
LKLSFSSVKVPLLFRDLPPVVNGLPYQLMQGFSHPLRMGYVLGVDVVIILSKEIKAEHILLDQSFQAASLIRVTDIQEVLKNIGRAGIIQNHRSEADQRSSRHPNKLPAIKHGGLLGALDIHIRGMGDKGNHILSLRSETAVPYTFKDLLKVWRKTNP